MGTPDGRWEKAEEEGQPRPDVTITPLPAWHPHEAWQNGYISGQRSPISPAACSPAETKATVPNRARAPSVSVAKQRHNRRRARHGVRRDHSSGHPGRRARDKLTPHSHCARHVTTRVGYISVRDVRLDLGCGKQDVWWRIARVSSRFGVIEYDEKICYFLNNVKDNVIFC